jgi:hypothetical protein
MNNIDIFEAGGQNDLAGVATGDTAVSTTVVNTEIEACAASASNVDLGASKGSVEAFERDVLGYEAGQDSIEKYRGVVSHYNNAKTQLLEAKAEFAEKHPDKTLESEIKNSEAVGMEIFGKVSQLPIHELAGSSVLMGFATDFSKLKADNPSLAGKSKRTLRDEYSPKQEEQYLPAFKSALHTLTHGDHSWVNSQEVRDFVAVTLANEEPNTPAAGSPYYPNYSGGMSLIDKFMKDGEFTSTISLMAKLGDCKKQYVAKGDGRVAVFQVNVLSSETVDSFTF